MISILIAISREKPDKDWCPIGREMQTWGTDKLFPFLKQFIKLEDRYETALVELILCMIRKEPNDRINIDQVVSTLKGKRNITHLRFVLMLYLRIFKSQCCTLSRLKYIFDPFNYIVMSLVVLYSYYVIIQYNGLITLNELYLTYYCRIDWKLHTGFKPLLWKVSSCQVWLCFNRLKYGYKTWIFVQRNLFINICIFMFFIIITIK